MQNPQEMTLEAAQKLLVGRVTDGHKANKKFLDGDHWQDGEGFPSLPPLYVENRQQIIDTIEKAFTSENVIGEIVERHLDGVIAREPDWNLVDTTAQESEQSDVETAKEKRLKETVDALVEWWNSRNMLETLREALAMALTQEKCVVRAYVPPGFVDETGIIGKQANLSDTLKMIQFEVLPADVAGVFHDSERFEPFGVFVIGEDTDKKVELTFLDEDGNTRLNVFEEQFLLEWSKQTLSQIAAYMPPDDSEGLPEIEPLNLNGNLLMFEVSRQALVDKQMRSLQRQVNLTWTMSGKNIVVAGSRERYFVNTQKPKKPTVTTGTDGSVKRTVKDAELNVGGSSATFLGGQPIYQGEDRKLVGYASANVIIVDPVASKNFHEQRGELKLAMLGGARQSHIQLNDMAAISGKSKQEGRAEFEKLLKRSKGTLDALGRWLLEVAMRFAAVHTGTNVTKGKAATSQEKEFESFRVDFNTIVDAGAPDPEQIKEDREDVKEGLLSVETYHARRGIEDPDAEKERLEDSIFYKLNLKKKQLEVFNLAKNAGFPMEEILVIVGYDAEEQKRLLPLMTNEIGSEN